MSEGFFIHEEGIRVRPEEIKTEQTKKPPKKENLKKEDLRIQQLYRTFTDTGLKPAKLTELLSLLQKQGGHDEKINAVKVAIKKYNRAVATSMLTVLKKK